MRFLIRLVLALVVVVFVGGVIFYAWAERHPEISPIEPPSPESFDSALIEQGRILAEIGFCSTCHTRVDGQPFAGGRAMDTPFGIIHSTNITPHADTGIGSWSEEAFIRAMHEGIDREGNYLYPAFPYDHFTRVHEEDLRAIYAYLMTQPPSADVPPDNELRFPANIRSLMAGWNLLFLDQGVFEPVPARDEVWNRGAYLVEGLGHCGACHTPRNALGAVVEGRAFTGGEAEGWDAPPLLHSSARVPWTVASMVNYLVDGWDGHHGVATGPMLPVVNHLYNVPESEVFAIATYLVSLQEGVPEGLAQAAIENAQALEYGGGPRPVPSDPALRHGEEVYYRACASCHSVGGYTAPLALTDAVTALEPRNLIWIIAGGLEAPAGAPDRFMSAFGYSFTDAEFTDLVNFIRDHFTDLPAWTRTAEQIAEFKEIRDSQ